MRPCNADTHRNMVLALQAGALSGPGSAVAEEGPWLLIDSGTDEAGLNLAVAAAADVGPDDLAMASEWFGARQASFCFLLRDDVHRAPIRVLVAAGLELASTTHAMLLSPLPPPAPAASAAPATGASPLRVLPVRHLHELLDFARLGADDYSDELGHALVRAVHDSGSFTMLLGHVDGSAIASALTMSTGSILGLYGVNVDAAVRRRGIATALIRQILEDGRANGSAGAFVEATDGGRMFYERLGFEARYRYLRFGSPHP